MSHRKRKPPKPTAKPPTISPENKTSNLPKLEKQLAPRGWWGTFLSKGWSGWKWGFTLIGSLLGLSAAIVQLMYLRPQLDVAYVNTLDERDHDLLFSAVFQVENKSMYAIHDVKAGCYVTQMRGRINTCPVGEQDPRCARLKTMEIEFEADRDGLDERYLNSYYELETIEPGDRKTLMCDSDRFAIGTADLRLLGEDKDGFQIKFYRSGYEPKSLPVRLPNGYQFPDVPATVVVYIRYKIPWVPKEFSAEREVVAEHAEHGLTNGKVVEWGNSSTGKVPIVGHGKRTHWHYQVVLGEEFVKQDGDSTSSRFLMTPAAFKDTR